MPRAEADAAKDQDTEVTPPDKGNGRILIVEDEPGVLDFVSDALRELGYETIAAADTKSALALVAKTALGIIIATAAPVILWAEAFWHL